jgi:hypothetical protein
MKYRVIKGHYHGYIVEHNPQTTIEYTSVGGKKVLVLLNVSNKRIWIYEKYLREINPLEDLVQKARKLYNASTVV